MRWEKLGRIYDAPNLHPKLRSHAANPVPVLLQGSIYRIFFNGRDDENRSSVGFVDFDIQRRQIVGHCQEPAFLHGPPGSYYSHGVSVGDPYTLNGHRYLWFMGWHQPPGEHWRGELGRLRIEGERLVLDEKEPILGLDEEDPVSLSYPAVVPDGIGGWHLWYGSTLTWDRGDGSMIHRIRYATSTDGLHWKRQGDAIPWEIGRTQAFSRPAVMQDPDGSWRMWFSYRADTGDAYRLGMATSPDAQTWTWGEPGIAPSAEGWDSEMIEYPSIFQHQGEWYLLYSGNRYGLSGFGLAILRR